jgi:hypothetical protein
MVDASHQEIGKILGTDHAAAILSAGPGQRQSAIDEAHEPEKIPSNSRAVNQGGTSYDYFESAFCCHGAKHFFCFPF